MDNLQSPIFELGIKVKTKFYPKPSKIIKREFNPQGMPNSNCWYYILSNDIHRFFREDHLKENIIVNKQLEMF